MRGANEAAWERFRLGEHLVLQNFDVIHECERQAARLKRLVVCEVRIGGYRTS